MQAILALIRKQFIEIRTSPQLRALTLFAPLIQLLLFGYAASLDVTSISLAVVDFDRSVQSREFIGSFVNSGYFKLAGYLDRYDQADTVLERGTARIVIVIPPGFSKGLLARRTVPVQALIDGADANTAAIAAGYAGGIIAGYSGTILLQTDGPGGGIARPAGGVNAETRVWYNPDLKSRRYFIPGVLGLLLLMTTVIASSTSIVKERETGTLEQLVVSPIKPYQIIIGKLAPFTVTAGITLMNLLILAAVVFHVTMRGNLLLFVLLTMIFLITVLGLGLFVSTISKTQQQASFTTSFFILPPFLFLSGFSFPIESMPVWIQPLTYLVPLRYYLVILRGIFLKGVGLEVLWPHLLALLAYGVVVFAASFLRFRKNLE
jgi:ABC-2 type transport system permease protein